MLITELKIENFRCYEFAEIPINSGITLIYGKNGSGKSSIIEGIYFGLSGKSFRTTDLNTLIRQEKDLTQTFISFNDASAVKITKKINMKCKILHVKDKKLLNYAQLVSAYPTCLIENKEFFFTTSTPEEKRAFLNKILFYVEQSASSDLKELKKVIYQRAACLKNRDKSQISFWNDKLVQMEPEITKFNTDIVSNINEMIQASEIKNHFVSKNPWIEKLSLKYMAGYDTNYKFSDVLDQNLEKDLILKRTTEGPHKRSFSLFLNNHLAHDLLSRGQQKVASIILHLMQRELIKKKTDTNPILLMDDISSELDKDNANLMLKYLINKSVQTVMTSIEKKRFKNEKDVFMFHVEQKGDMSNVR